MTDAVIKIDLQKAIQTSPVIVELGCGRVKQPGAIGIDRVDLPDVDIVTDMEKGLPFLPDDSVDELYAFSVLEHMHNFDLIMKEIVRVLKKTGKAHIFVPHFSNPYYYSDPTHLRFFGLYTFYYYVPDAHQMKRKVPDYYFDIKIRIVSQKIVFDSPFIISKIFNYLLGCVFNLANHCRNFTKRTFVT